MSSAVLSRRLAKLENARSAAASVHTIFGTDRAEMAAQEAAMVAAGQALATDRFIHFLTIYEPPPVWRTGS